MSLSIDEAETILLAMGFAHSEDQMNNDAINLCIKIFQNYPELEKSHSYLRTCN